MKKLALILLAITSSQCLADKWTAMGQIQGTYVDMRATPGRILIKHQAARSDECTSNGNYYHLDLSSPDSQHAYSLILSAEARKANIRFYHHGCSTAGFPVVKIASTW